MTGLTVKRSDIRRQLTGCVVCAILVTGGALVYGQASQVTFTDIIQQSGIDFRYTFGDFTYDNIMESSGSGISVFDYDNDGDLDLYMLNGTYLEDISDPKGRVFRDTPNRLYRNNGDGTFIEVSKEAGVDDRHWSMAAGTLDYDSDGDVDLYLLNYGPNVFYLNNGDGTFTDIADSLHLRGPETLNGFTKWSVSVAFWDYDLDGDVDLMVGNFLAFDPYFLSPTTPHLMPHPSMYRGQASIFYRQESGGTFAEATEELGLYYPESMCMGLTVFDYDDDGDLDIIVSHIDLRATAALLRNDGGNQNHWLKLTLVGNGGAPSAIGARVTIEIEGHKQVSVNQWATSYLSFNDPRMHFGLGKHDRVDRMIIKWHGGLTDVFRNLAADQHLTVVQGEGIKE